MRLRAAAFGIVAATFLLSAFPAPARARTTGQGQRAQPGSTSPASISGAVRSQVDSAPVARARVILSSSATTHARVSLSDPQGRYEFSGVPPGDYEILVMRSGYALVGASARGLPVSVASGERRTGLALVLQRAGTIPGRVEDEDGSPLAGAQVEALSLRASDQQQSLLSAALTYTDDRGEFRLTGLPAGQYFVRAHDGAFSRAGDETGALRYPPTYFPGVLAAADAKPMSVPAGGESPRAEFRIRVVKPAHVSGVMKAPDARPFLSGAVVLVPRDGTVQPMQSEDVDIRPDGYFVFRNVPPGSYQLRARAALDAKQVLLFGSFAVRVEPGKDVSDLVVALAPGAVVHGKVEWLGEKPPDLQLRVRAPFADGTSFGDALTGGVAADGTFRLRGVMTGLHLFAIEGLPEPWMLTAVRVRGRDRQLQPVDLHEGEQLSNVHLVLSEKMTELGGAITDPAGRAAADALILLLPPAATRWSPGDPRFRAIRSDAAGRYRVRGLPPGPYRIAALIAVDELAAWRPDWLKSITQHARSISVTADAAQTLDVVALTPEALPAAVSR